MKKIILITLLILSLTTQSLGRIRVDVEVDDRADVRVIIESNYEREPIAIEVYDDDRIYYINQDMTYRDGSSEFSFRLEKNKEYDGKINIDGKKKKFSISTEEDLQEKIVYVYIKGYEGVILSKTQVEIEEDDTVIDVLERVLEDKGIEYKIKNGYVKSIDGQAEFDIGAKSGWMFSINDEFPEIGAVNVEVDDEDYIKWLYTKNLGEDVGAIYNELLYAEEEIEKALEKAQRILESSKSSEEEIIKSIAEIVEILDDNFLDIERESDAKILIDYVGETLRIVEKSTDKIESHKYEKKIIGTLDTLLKFLLESSDFIKDEEMKGEIKKDTSRIVSISLGVMAEIEDMEDLDKDIEGIIESIDKLMNKLEQEKKLYIERLSKDKDEIKFKFPQGFLRNIFDGNIDKIEIKTQIASLHIGAHIFDNAGMDKEVLIQLKKVNEPVSGLQDSRVFTLDIMVDGKEVYDLHKPIEISIPYDTQEKKIEDLDIFLLKSDGTRERIVGGYDKSIQSVEFVTSQIGKYIIGTLQKEFLDLNNHTWAKDAVETMAQKGIVNGRTDTEFDPNARITRAEFTALITRMLEYHMSSDVTIPFEDVDKNSWYYNPIAIAYDRGLISGKAEGIFDPQGNISREEIASIVAKVLVNKSFNIEEDKNLDFFKDRDDIALWAKSSVELVAKKGVITGMEDGNFAPKKKANRAEAIVILYRLYNLLKNE
ncbi:MAG: S-layer homology domain-containing protein [Clostridia bacterium]|nr:S-layer homology domain-containing protein [Clostridia bacterium]